MIWSKRKTTNKSNKIKTARIKMTSKSQDAKSKPLFCGWDKPQHTKQKQKEQLKLETQKKY
jgi:hypothetical protein